MDKTKMDTVRPTNYILDGSLQGHSYHVEAVFSKWGNSQGIRIPKTLSDMLDIHINDKVEISVHDQSICIKKINKYNNLRERLEAFYGKPLDSIFVEDCEEVDWGGPDGEEIW